MPEGMYLPSLTCGQIFSWFIDSGCNPFAYTELLSFSTAQIVACQEA